MTDISKEAVDAAQRFIDAYFDNPNTKRPEITIPAKETNTDLTLIRSIKALSARVAELEELLDQMNKAAKEAEAAERWCGRLQGLDEAAKLAADDEETLPSNCGCRYGKAQGEICSRATARNLKYAIEKYAIEALKEQSND